MNYPKVIPESQVLITFFIHFLSISIFLPLALFAINMPLWNNFQKLCIKLSSRTAKCKACYQIYINNIYFLSRAV